MSKSIEVAVAPRRRIAWQVLSWAALLIAFVYFAFRGPIFPNGQRLWDYAVCASSSYLWAHGQDPFDWDAVKASWIARGSAPGIENDVWWLYAIVPPTTLVVLSPFAVLPVAVGAYLYLCMTTVLVGLSTWVCGKWANITSGNVWRMYIAAVLVSVPATLGLYSGNPTMLAAPLLIIGSYLIATDRSRTKDVFGGVLIGVGVACKLQIGMPILVLWLILGRWRAAVTAITVVTFIGILGIVRLESAEIEWLASWIENVRKTNSAGGLNDYASAANPDDLINLQVGLYRLFKSRAATELSTIVIWGSLSLTLLVGLLRRKATDTQTSLAAISAVGLLTLIPVYHRTYDAIILLPLLAMAIAMVSIGAYGRRQFGAIVCLLLGSLAVPAGLPYFLTRGKFEFVRQWKLFTMLAVPHKGWCILIISVLLIIWFVWRFPGGNRRVEAGSSSKNPDTTIADA